MQRATRDERDDDEPVDPARIAAMCNRLMAGLADWRLREQRKSGIELTVEALERRRNGEVDVVLAYDQLTPDGAQRILEARLRLSPEPIPQLVDVRE